MFGKPFCLVSLLELQRKKQLHNTLLLGFIMKVEKISFKMN